MIFQKDTLLAQYSNYKIGGPAKLFIEAKTREELTQALAEATKLKERVFILGGGNNLLISDKGFDGVVIKVSIGGISVDANNVVTVGAGVLVSDFLKFCVEQSLDGWQWAGGLPGTIGGAVWGNAGAFGGETKDAIVRVASLRVASLGMNERQKRECGFGYRTSIFKEQQHSYILQNVGMSGGGQEVIISAQFQLQKGDKVAIEKVIQEKMQYRKDRQPIEYPNIGSIFKNIPVEQVPPATLAQFSTVVKHDPFPVLPVAALSSEAGLKEYRIGDAMVSPKHPNFIVNMGQATAKDVLAVMAHVKQTLKDKFGVILEQEVIWVE